MGGHKSVLKNVSRFGFWSAVFALVWSIAYIIPQIAQVSGYLTLPLDLILILIPSLLLAPSFVVLMISIHYYAPDERKIWSHVGFAFAIIYAVLVSIVYIVNLTVVVPNILQGEAGKVVLLTCCPPGSFMAAIDGLGYGFQSLATLFAAPVFAGGKLESWVRRAFITNGLLAPAIILALVYPALIIIGALWIITFLLSAALAAVLFRRSGQLSKELEQAGVSL